MIIDKRNVGCCNQTPREEPAVQLVDTRSSSSDAGALNVNIALGAGPINEDMKDATKQ